MSNDSRLSDLKAEWLKARDAAIESAWNQGYTARTQQLEAHADALYERLQRGERYDPRF